MVEDAQVRALAERIEKADAVSAEDAGAVRSSIAALVGAETAETVGDGAFSSSDSMLLLIDRVLPGWTITIDGVASEQDGHWVCVLRNSGGRDNDPFVGIGKAPVLSHALLSALLHVLAFMKPS